MRPGDQIRLSPGVQGGSDARAKALNLSRNRFIVETLEKALSDNSTWSPEFLEFLHGTTPIDSGREFLKAILSDRRSKKVPPDL
jgi:hypothetical protein